MESENNHIDLLISKKLSGQATPEELTELETWLNRDRENQKLFEKSRQIWVNSRNPFSLEEIQKDHQKIQEQIIHRLSFSQKKNRFRMFYRVAAILVIPLLLAAGWYWGKQTTSFTPHEFCEVTAPKGQIAECVLSDGTHVWLNAETTIQYDPTLAGKNRMVNLKGEAYFKVTKKQHRPFIVNTPEMQVKVFGTSFNVRAYPEENKTETTLEEGKVELRFKTLSKQSPVKLKPGEYAVYQPATGNLQVEHTDTYLHTAWRDGKYIFKDADLKTIVLHLERLYDVRIHLKNETMGQLRFRGMFEYDQNIFDALETIERTTSLKYRMDGRDIWLE